MELKETVALMESNDFKDRFRAEYYQTKIRYENLHDRIDIYKTGKYKPKCGIDLCEALEKVMKDYLFLLEVRAKIEGIKL